MLEPQASAFELILVNDGSRDGSWDVDRASWRGEHPWVRGIDLMRNYGQHNALLCGIRAARYEVIVTLDDDLQNPPEEIPKLLDTLDERLDVVYGTPESEQHGLWRDLASRVTQARAAGARWAPRRRATSAPSAPSAPSCARPSPTTGAPSSRSTCC